MRNKPTVIVTRISIHSLNRLLELGYNVVLVTRGECLERFYE
jgi:hypothetical protein